MNSTVPILVVDRNPALLKALSQSLHDQGFRVLTADSPERGIQLTREQRPGLVLLASSGSAVENSHQQMEREASRAGIPVVVFPGAAALPTREGQPANGQQQLKIAPAEELRSLLDLLAPLRRTTVARLPKGPHEEQRELLEMLPEGIIFVDQQGCVKHANGRVATLLGYADADVLRGKTIFELVVPKERARLRKEVAAGRCCGTVRRAEYDLLDAAGKVCPVELSVAAWRDAEEQPCGLVFLMRDVSEQKRAEKRMQELQEIINQAEAAVVIRDLKGKIHYANPAVERIFGWKQEELGSRSERELFFDDPADYDAAEKELLRSGRWDGELRVRTKSRQRLVIQARWRLVRGTDGEPDYVVEIGTDITERRRTERSLKEREQLSHTIIETALHGFWMVDLQGRLLDVNEAYCQMCGYSRTELVGKHISDLEINESSREAVASHIEQIIRNGGDRFETRHRRKDGGTLDLEVSATYLQLGHPYLFAFLNDVTERKRLEQEQRHFSQQAMAAQEAERSRLGRELHDGVNQIIASAKMRLQKVEERSGMLGPAMCEILARCDQLLLQALNENRRLAHNLHPSDLHDLGLVEACRTLCRDVESRSSMMVKPVLPRRWRKLTPGEELNLFRIAQESISNVEQHAQAKSVQLELGLEQDAIVMKISDDGRGFNPSAKARARKRGLGLANIRERATLLGGTCAVVSTPKHGTTITIRVPRKRAPKEVSGCV